MVWLGLLAVLISPGLEASIEAPPQSELKLGVRYAFYLTREEEADAEMARSSERLQKVFDDINRIWGTCGIRFEVEMSKASPTRSPRANRIPVQLPELYEIRRELRSEATLLVAVTDPWTRNGSVGKSGANAWTAMPGSRDHGIVIEWPQRWNANLLAHELGHYLGLDHQKTRSELMAPVIYRDSKGISPAECDKARRTVQTHWKRMLREDLLDSAAKSGPSNSIRASRRVRRS